MTHDMWLALIGVLALAVAGAIAVLLYAVKKGYKIEPKTAAPPKAARAAKAAEAVPAASADPAIWRAS